MQQANLSSWLIWLAAGIFYLFEFIHRVIISVMIPELMGSFDVSLARLGSLSACYFYAYALAQIPVGWLIDRYGSRYLLTAACLTISAGSLVFANANHMLLADMCRILIGFSSAFAFVGCLKLGATWFPNHKFGFIVGLTNLLGVTGAIIGGKPAAYAVDAYGWRQTMLLSAIIGAVLAFILWVIIKDKAPAKNIHKTNSKILSVIKCKQTWLVAVFGGLMVAPITTYSELWGVSFLVNNYELSRPAAAQIATLTFIGIAIGGPTIGWLSDYLRLRKRPMFIGAIGAFCSIGAIVFAPLLPLWLLYLLHLTFGFFTSSMLLCYSLISEATPTSIRATTIALTNSIVMLFGALLQTISGILLDYSHLDYNLSFAPLIGCYLLALICFYFIHETNCCYTNKE